MEEEPAPAVSVVVPHLNDAAGLARCLAALAAQRGAPPFEVVVVDNGSAEPPAALVARHRFARLAAEPRPGPGPARSRGAALARAPLLAFTDSDCIPDPGWLAAIAAAFAADPGLAVAGGEVTIALADPARPTAIEAYESVFGYRMRLYVERDGYAATCNMAVRAAAFAAVGPFAGLAVAEDMDWGRRATALGLRPRFLPGMRVATPARPDFAALARKWDRQIAHDWGAARAGGPGARLRWLARAAALPLSPLAEIPAIAATGRLSGPRARLLALAATARIRAWRARRMWELALGLDPARLAGAWNRPRE